MGLFNFSFKKEKEQDKYSFFWNVMDLCDWKYEGEDDKVLEPVILYLSKQDDELIFLFEDVMTELLYNLDTKVNYERCKEISGQDSDDLFLYSRCVALLNGRDYYQSCLENGFPDELWNMEFESLLYVPEEAWGRKHGSDSAEYSHMPPLSYETGSNEEGWKNRMDSKITEKFGDLSVVDIIYARPDEDCAVLVLVTVGYIDGSPETQKDLLDKLEGYLKYIQSNDFRKAYLQSKVYINIQFQEKPDVLITDLLYKCMKWCKENGAYLRLRIGDDYVHFTD